MQKYFTSAASAAHASIPKTPRQRMNQNPFPWGLDNQDGHLHIFNGNSEMVSNWLVFKYSKLVFKYSRLLSFVSVDTSYVSIDTSFVSVDTSFVSFDTKFVSIDTSFISEATSLVSDDTWFISDDRRLVSDDRRFEYPDMIFLKHLRVVFPDLGSLMIRLQSPSLIWFIIIIISNHIWSSILVARSNF